MTGGGCEVDMMDGESITSGECILVSMGSRAAERWQRWHRDASQFRNLAVTVWLEQKAS